jgi:hypothetical protein
LPNRCGPDVPCYFLGLFGPPKFINLWSTVKLIEV